MKDVKNKLVGNWQDPHAQCADFRIGNESIYYLEIIILFEASCVIWLKLAYSSDLLYTIFIFDQC